MRDVVSVGMGAQDGGVKHLARDRGPREVEERLSMISMEGARGTVQLAEVTCVEQTQSGPSGEDSLSGGKASLRSQSESARALLQCCVYSLSSFSTYGRHSHSLCAGPDPARYRR